MKPQALEKRIRAEWGERCPDHDDDCPVCKAWQWFDKVTKPKGLTDKPSPC